MKRELGKIFITGANGFIGSHLVEKLLENGHQVTALCKYNSESRAQHLEGAKRAFGERLTTVFGDIRDQSFIEHVSIGHQTVFHLAALIGIPYSYDAPASYLQTNVFGTYNVAQACLRNNIGRLIHTSTSEVYGSAEQIPIREDHPLKTQSPYSASKLGADKLVESFVCSFGLKAVTLRPFNTYGPRQSQRAVIPSIIAQALWGDGTLRVGSLYPRRDFNFVEDTVAAFIKLAEAEDGKTIGKVFNAGSGIDYSVEEVVRIVEEVSSRSLRIQEDQIRVRPDNSEVERLLAGSEKLTKATGWSSKTALKDGIIATVKWMHTQRPEVSAYKT